MHGCVAEAGTQALDQLRHRRCTAAVEREELARLRPRLHQRAAAQPQRRAPAAAARHAPAARRAALVMRAAVATGSAKRRRRRVAGASRCSSRSSSDSMPAPRPCRNAHSSSSSGSQARCSRAVSASLRLEVAARGEALRARRRRRADRARGRAHDRARRACCGSKRRAKPSRGRRRHSPTVRTPIVASDCSVRSGQRVTASGNGASRAASASGRRSSSSCPARANHNEASGVGVSARRGASPRACRRSRSSSHNRRAPPNSAQAAAHLEQHAVGRLEVDARREIERHRGHGLEQRPLAPRLARPAPRDRAAAPGPS